MSNHNGGDEDNGIKRRKERTNVRLKKFTFSNVYSFMDETSINMEARYPSMKDNEDFVREHGEGSNKEYFLPLAAIYGKNASGKTNVLRALADAAAIVCGKSEINRMTPFLLATRPSPVYMHRFNLLIDNYEYEYEYSTDILKNAILTESLKRREIGNEKWQDLFTRKESKVQFNKDGLSSQKVDYIKSSPIYDDSLIVTSYGQGVDELRSVFKWCENVEVCIKKRGDSERQTFLDNYATNFLSRDCVLQEKMSKFFSDYEENIESIRVIPDESSGQRFTLRVSHKGMSDEGKEFYRDFPFYMESHGTQRLAELYPYLSHVLETGRTLIVDELDIVLHPAVFRVIVDFFNDKKHNPNHAQLIFSAHNTIVMHRDNVRRDQLNLIDKNEYGRSSLFRLSEYEDENGNKIRSDSRYDHLYMNGSLGTAPDKINDATIL